MTRAALEEIATIYQQNHPNVVINYTFGGTKVIQTFIEEGQPFDGVAMAEIKPMEQLQAQALILPESRRNLVTTDMVVIAPIDSTVTLSDFRELTNPSIKTIAMGNQKLAVGRYTHEILAHLNIADAVGSKAVFATLDVREILIDVEQGRAQVGITFLSEAKSSQQVKVLATAPPNSHQPVQASAAILTTSLHPQETKAYLDFLITNPAKAIFQKFGLRPLKN